MALQSLLHVGLDGRAGVAVAGALALAALGLTAGLAALCFTTLAGVVALGARRPALRQRQIGERPLATRAVLAGAAAATLLLPAAAGWLLPTLVALAPGPVGAAGGARLDLPGTGGLPALALPIAVALATALLVRARGGAGRAAVAPTWICGQTESPALLWSAAAFTKPLRLVLERMLRPVREQRRVEGPAGTLRVDYVVHFPHPIEQLYAAAQRRALALARRTRALQSGSLSAYVLYLLALVLAALAIVRLGGGA